MNEQVFSESQGSPRLPSASFARVEQGSNQGQDLPPASETIYRYEIMENGTVQFIPVEDPAASLGCCVEVEL